MKILFDKDRDGLKDLIIAVGGFIITAIQANNPNPDHLAIYLANGCMGVAIYLNLTEG